MVIDKERCPDFKVVRVTGNFIVVSSETLDQIRNCDRAAKIVFLSIRSRFNTVGKAIYCTDMKKKQIKDVLEIVHEKMEMKSVVISCPQHFRELVINE